MTVGRETQIVTEVLESVDPKGRQTQVVAEVLESIDSTGRQTQIVVEVLLFPIQPLFFSNPFTARALVTAILSLTADDALSVSINASGIVTAAFTPTFQVNVSANATVDANLTGTFNFITSIDVSAFVSADLQERTLFTAAISASGLVVVNLRENIEYLVPVITASAVVTADLNVPWKTGNTLELVQSADVDLVANVSPSNTLALTQAVVLNHAIRHITAENVLNLTDLAERLTTLPVQTASNTLVLIQSADFARQASSFLILTQDVTGIISFLEAVASNTLNLTDLAEFDGSIFTRSLESLLNLTQLAEVDIITDISASNTIIFSQDVVGTKLTAKTFMLFQAPFNFIQTSIVVPSPLLDDTENLVSNMKLNRNMDGDPYTYVKTNKSKLLKYTFILDRLKGLEFEAFLDAYNGSDIKMQNWKGEIWKVKVITNPIDFVQTGRYEPGSDRTDVDLEFEGVKISG